jgi:hypothetical protein
MKKEMEGRVNGGLVWMNSGTDFYVVGIGMEVHFTSHIFMLLVEKRRMDGD